MNIHDILNLVYETEALLRMLADPDVAADTEKSASIVNLLKNKASATVDALDAIMPTDNEAAEDYPSESFEEIVDPEEEIAEIDKEIADNAIFEEEADADESEFEDDQDLFDEEIENEPELSEPVFEDEPELIEEEFEDEPEQPESEFEEVPEEEEIAGNALFEEAADADEADDDTFFTPTIGEETAKADVNQSAFIKMTGAEISKAFTLNDKFRFRRELFGNSPVEFNDAINLIDAMRSPAEAEEYFYTELGWDPENEDVRDFMNIVTSFLAGK